jgi:hypothetical protein
MGPAVFTMVAPMVSNGPSKDITDSLEWAQYFSQGILCWPQMGLVFSIEHSAEDLEWVQYNWQVTLLAMALNGPNIPQNGYYRWSPVDPAQLAG